jgi:hypothetical protein
MTPPGTAMESSASRALTRVAPVFVVAIGPSAEPTVSSAGPVIVARSLPRASSSDAPRGSFTATPAGS